MGHFNMDDIGWMKVLVPPLAEQREIVGAVARDTASLTQAGERAEREIDLLREYRTRLIADVVTGKLDAREAAARLPEEGEAPEPLDTAWTWPSSGLPARDPAGGRRGARPRPGRPDAPQVPGPPAGRDQQARHHRRAAPRHQARPAPPRPLLRHALAGQPKAAERYAANRFSVTRQLRYSRDETQLALDLGLFINGLPVATFELKNSLTKQTVEDAVEQYKRDRDPRERLFEFGRCVVHFAVDDHEVRFCTHLKGKASWFLPFNQGWNDGAGNPPNPDGLKTDYLWKRILTRDGPDRHPRELRPGRRDQGREDRQEEGGADLPALPPARRGAQAPGRRRASTARAGAT